MAENPNQLQKPPGASTPSAASEPIIHVMPAEFRGGKTPMAAPAKPAAPVAAPLPAKPVVAQPPKLPVAPVAKKRRLPPALLIGGVLFLAVAIASGALLLSLNTSQTPVVINTTNTQPVVTTPQPECSDTDPCGTGFTCSDAGECVAEVPAEPVAPTGGSDTDSDGLTDIEEVLFGSLVRNPDSDSDTYLDGNEVYHLYNPRGDAPGLLIDTGFARTFTTDELDFQVVYPSRWTIQLLSATSGVMFKVPTGEFVQVSTFSKDSAVDIASWYLTQNPDATASEITPLTTRQGYSGILSPDKLSTYLDHGDVVHVLSYNLGEVTSINFLTTYQMMVNSFVLKK